MNPWTDMAAKVGIPCVLLLGICYFFVKFVWPTIPTMKELINDLKGDLDKAREEAKSDRESARNERAEFLKALEAHRETAEHAARASEQLADEISQIAVEINRLGIAVKLIEQKLVNLPA